MADDERRHYSILVFGRGMASQQPVVHRILSTGGEVINTAPEGVRMTATLTPMQALDSRG